MSVARGHSDKRKNEREKERREGGRKEIGKSLLVYLRWLYIEAFLAASVSSPDGANSPMMIYCHLLMMSLPHQKALVPVYLMLT